LGEGNKLPLRDRTVREVFMANVLNTSFIDDATKIAILAEINRVLEDGGRLVTQVNWHQSGWPVGKTKQLLKDNDFQVLKIIKATTDIEYQRLEEEYGVQENARAPKGYYVIAERPDVVQSAMAQRFRGLLKDIVTSEQN